MSFDPAVFESTVYEEANETKTTPLPEGDYVSIIEAAKVTPVGRKDGSTVPVLRVTHQLQDLTPDVLELMGGRDKVTVQQTIWLDLNEKGSLAFGPNQNVGLGRLREAAGCNKPGKPFSIQDLAGRGPINVRITHYQNDAGDTYNRINLVSKG